jgi:hypothetical protein
VADNVEVTMLKEKLIEKIRSLGISELQKITDLNELNGDYVNNESLLPNGERRKILDDRKRYWCAQVEIADSDKCYGVAADETQIAVFRYGGGGSDSELMAWLKL